MIKQLQPFSSPARYIFKDPDTNHEYIAETEKDLKQHIITYREQNRLPKIEMLAEVLQAYWCSLPENAANCRQVKLQRGFLTYIHGGIRLIGNFYYGEKNMVTDAEADRRAEICTGCDLNKFPDKGGFVKWADELAEASTFGKKSNHYEKLGNCMGCSCNLRAKVWYKGPMELSPKEYKQIRDVTPSCWQIEDDTNLRVKA